MNFYVGFATDIGRKRSQNQDNGAAHPEFGLFVVADGMGGHRGGETASAMASDLIVKGVSDRLQKGEAPGRQLLAESIRTANNAIYSRSVNEPQLQGMGTTATALLFHGDQLTLGQVGDSRAYLVRPSGLWQLTRDHSLVQEKLRAGIITREQVKTDKMKNVITRSVGFEMNVNVETFDFKPQSGDVFLICSDGLSGLIEDRQIEDVVQEEVFGKKDIQGGVCRLIDTANQNGGDDNITAILVQTL